MLGEVREAAGYRLARAVINRQHARARRLEVNRAAGCAEAAGSRNFQVGA